ncbi:LacI family DNA-binding transcriptional regulator [Thermus sp.]|uniref:LacI family DNA-binding transcriptional regulator n=1 Tax=Thermus sp. TaxID=275 RepID=UPI0025F01787|nr:LacI family DNA-binding transcriptional regulator [Thermus sp.]MCS6867213.1 LacI family transcriptional regulator [Thermus sp.]MCX7850793.1 LacI family transcriptional regulator [Thermus sp.]MDW8358589.1 LacI family DNA-binding transcriptional regulator [Thermus sp.]
MRKVRLKEVAEAAGVSPALASAVLNGRPVRARPETRERVLEAARRLGYQPDRVAQAMRWGSPRLFALVIPNFSNPFYSRLALEVQREAWAHGYDLLVYANPHHELERVLRAALAHRVDGAILVVSHHRPEELALLGGLDLPLVGVGHAASPLPFDRVSFQDQRAAQEAVAFLHARGRRRIAHLSGPFSSPTAQARLRGYLEGMAALGLEPRVAEGNFGYGGNGEAIARLLKEGMDALLAANDLMALEALALLADRGVRVPEEVAVVGFDGIPEGEWVRPRLTTLARPPEASAQKAVARLLARLSGDPSPPGLFWLEARLLVREST